MSDSRTVALRMATPADAHLPAYDFTKLSAINTCLRWGIIRYTQHRTLPNTTGARAMALEAGHAMHECFAAVRLWQLGIMQDMPELAAHHGARLFGQDRWMELVSAVAKDDDPAAQLRNMALQCLASSGFTDSDDDKRRTYSNLETSLLYYCQRWDHMRYPVWVRDTDDPRSDVGIELSYDIVVSFNDVDVFRHTGRVDGIHVDRSGELLAQENKTASRLNTAWRLAFNTSHQVTGYTVAASLFTEQPVNRAMVLGLSLPLPRTMSDGLVMETVSRPGVMRTQWMEWMCHTIQLHDRYKDAPLAAPMYTHSCNRYFSPCALIPLCAAADRDEQEAIMAEMVHDEWSPLTEQHGNNE